MLNLLKAAEVLNSIGVKKMQIKLSDIFATIRSQTRNRAVIYTD